MTYVAPNFERPFSIAPQRGTSGRVLSTFADKIRCDDRIRALSTEHSAASIRILADLKGRVKRNGRLVIKSAYWSAQSQSSDRAFSGLTLACEKDQPPTWYEFPSDPGLPHIRKALRKQPSVHVLRYVPFRRLTVCSRIGREQVVVKMKRLERLEEAARRLAAAETAIKESGASFSTPRLLDVDPAVGTMTQSYCPGRPLINLPRRASIPDTFGKIGKLHAELHSVQAFDLPTRPSFTGAELMATISWLSVFRPDVRDRLELCRDVLCTTAPRSKNTVFCHGDFACSQLLVAGEKWSLVDFDLCHRGDRYRDVAVFLVSLRRELTLPNLNASDFVAAENAYIVGYEDTAGIRLNADCLHWHRAIAEFEYLKFILRKDRYEPDIFDASVVRLEASCGVLRS